MFNYKKIITYISFIALILLSSCTMGDGQAKEVKYNITQGDNLKGVQQINGTYLEFESYSTESINYYFEAEKYIEEQRNDLVKKFEILRDFLANKCNIPYDEPLSVYASEKNIYAGRDKKIFINDLNIESIDMTAVVLQSLYGSTSNYGLRYGIACYINEKLYSNNIDQDISIEELGEFYSEKDNLVLLDLTIPVFQDIYFSQEQNKYAYATAYYLNKDLIERNGLEYALDLLKNSVEFDLDFDNKYANEKNIWLKNINATENYEVPEAPIRYELTSDKKLINRYPYLIYTPSLKVHIPPDMVNNEFSWVYSREEEIMDYNYLQRYLIMYEKDVTALKKYLSKYIDTNVDIIDCYFERVSDTSKISYYSNLNNKIVYVTPFYAGVHEYAHRLTMPNVPKSNFAYMPEWLYEGIAVYCQSYLENQGVYRLMNEYISKAEMYYENHLYDVNFPDKDTSFMKFCYDSIALNAAGARNTLEWKSDYARSKKKIELTYPEYGSFTNYLIEKYGEEKYFELFVDHTKIIDIYGKGFDSLYEEWYEKLYNSISYEYITNSDGLKIWFSDISVGYIPSKRSFVDILGDNKYEYIDCNLGRNKDDEENPDANGFDGLDLNGKIALIKLEVKEGNEVKSFSKQINNAAKAGAIGIIIYGEYEDLEDNATLCDGITEDVPVIMISIEDVEILKNAKEKYVTVDKGFISVIDNNY